MPEIAALHHLVGKHDLLSRAFQHPGWHHGGDHLRADAHLDACHARQKGGEGEAEGGHHDGAGDAGGDQLLVGAFLEG